MKFLLVFTLLIGSAFANTDGDWKIKCFERDNGDLDLAYIIKVNHQNDEVKFNRSMELYDCTGSSNAGEMDEMSHCRERGHLKKVERQEESCLVLYRHAVDGSSWSLCYEEQETYVESRLVPVTVTDDRQDSRIYCERSILRVL